MSNYSKGVAVRTPLLPNEIPDKLKALFHLDRQEMVQRRGKRRSTIWTTCKNCGNERQVLVSVVRQAIRKGTFTGVCKGCINEAIPRNYRCGDTHYAWKGGRITQGGYAMVRDVNHPSAKNGYVQEHRLVMEVAFGRLLSASETVHHRNGNKLDNRLENLEVWVRKHSDGQRYSDLPLESLRKLKAEIELLIEAKASL